MEKAEKERQERIKEEKRQQEIHDRINYLLEINPETANAYIQAMKDYI